MMDTFSPKRPSFLLFLTLLLSSCNYNLLSFYFCHDMHNNDTNDSTTATGTPGRNTMLVFAAASNKDNTETSTSDTCLNPSSQSSCSNTIVKQPQGCNYYYELSKIKGAGLGLFTVRDIPPKVKVAYPDLVIHVVDPVDGLFLGNYTWDSHATGGQYEGTRYVAAVVPGIGMSTNGAAMDANVLPLRALVVDEADVPRTEASGAGSFTHYYNMTFYTSRHVHAGEELLHVPYGQSRVDGPKLVSIADDKQQQQTYSVEQLVQHGLCADNIKSDVSTISGAGRGAFATRFIPKGARIAPLPLLPLKKQSLKMMKTETKNRAKLKATSDTQLLINYCFGHARSDVLLYPYSGGVNFINNHPNDANSILTWSDTHRFHHTSWLNDTPEQLLSRSKAGLMLDLIATQDIFQGDEIFLNYGVDWNEAWEKHKNSWMPVDNADQYSPSYVMNDVVDLLRTQEEEKQFYSYPDNLQTACFYNYQKSSDTNNNNNDDHAVTLIKWRPRPGIQDLRYLRPCTILKREQQQQGATTSHRYTVQMWNRAYNMTPPDQRIPKEEENRHIVEQVPRVAMRFVDKPYSTDQHLPNAFRHWIGLEPFPDAWITTTSNNNDETSV